MPPVEKWKVVKLGDHYTWGLVTSWGTVRAIHGDVFDTEGEAHTHMKQTMKALKESQRRLVRRK